jgi:hypothetical protein
MWKKYDKQDQQEKAAFNERNPHMIQQQEPVARSPGGILLKPVLRGMHVNFHFPLLSVNRLNQTETATFSILSGWAFFGSLYFSLSNRHFSVVCSV